MGVSIVIPTWNGLSLLQQFLPSVIAAADHYDKHSHDPTEILIVDDGSTDETTSWLRQAGFRNNDDETTSGSPRLRIVRNKTNLGFGETCNRGIELAAHPLVFLLNNDVEPERECIAPLVENFEDSSVFAAHCRVFEFDSGRECGTGKLGGFSRGFIRVHESYSVSEPGEPTGTPLYSMFAGGGSAMFDRQKFLEIGGFEALLSPFYWEDVELSYRAWKRGYSILYEPRSIARHRISSTIGTLDRRSVRRIEQRNRLIFHWINLHDTSMFASHVARVLLLALTAPLRLQPGFLWSLAAATGSWRQIRDRRREEKLAARRSDRGVFKMFDSLAKL